MNVLKVIHGYPPYYMAGSEVYTYNLCNALKKRLNITVFTRIEDIYSPMYHINESSEYGIKIIRVNKPKRDYTFRDKYIDKQIAKIFEVKLLEIKPDIVHIGHLSHLTVLIVDIIKKYDIPIVFTLHDYWMICIKGQLIKENFQLCSGPTIEKCFRCNKKYFLNKNDGQEEIKKWIKEMTQINKKIDLFIAPSKFLKKIYIKNGIPSDKIVYMDYGFNKEYFEDLQPKRSEKIRFGFLGRIIPVKGIDLLIRCFNEIDPEKAQLSIYGRLDKSSKYLENIVRNSNINFLGGYNYREIGDVLTNIDVLVVPSIWYENSPLVIHEALIANIPVITSNLGGMAELIEDGKNGLLFEPGNIQDLRNKISRIIDHPELIKYLSRESTYVKSIEKDAENLMAIYKVLTKQEEEINQVAF